MPNGYFHENYIPVLIDLGLIVVVAGGMLLLSYLLGQHKRTREKLMPYECGMTPTGDASHRFSIRFYLVAMIFILLDVEVVFLFPWAVIFRELKMFGFIEMLLFVLIVVAGFVYLWKKGVLDWSRREPGEMQ
ncbi:MAG: NADH-quinone oxidoreductase subunit A [Acidobacteria bacterium]|nr:NADH-quinone oxidoreductase subunit A [Acidobacteriota bacterium]